MKQPQLIEMQLILLEILKDFHNFYVRHHLKYMLFAGSLLGAIRHEGFIPWGDDIDVAMPHQDFESFLKHWDNDDSHLFLQNHDSDKHYIHNFSHILKKNTTALQDAWKTINMYNGILIDVFPFDNIPNDNREYENPIRKIKNLTTIRHLRLLDITEESSSRLEKIDYKLLHTILRFLQVHRINNYGHKLRTKYNDITTDPISELSLSYTIEYAYKFNYSKNVFEELILVTFEESQFYIPRNYHDIFTKNYGD